MTESQDGVAIPPCIESESMEEPDIDRMTQHLEAVLGRQRREVLAYTILTVLCTPAFVAIASLVIVSVVLFVVCETDYRVDSAVVLYTGMIAFLGSALALTSTGANKSASGFELDRNWLAGVTVLLSLISVAYMTSLRETSPACFGVLYFVLAFLVLGLAGRAYVNEPPRSRPDETPTARAFAVAAAGFIVSAYAELFSVSWLWMPPKPRDVRIAARVLCRLAADDKGPLHECVVEDRIERLLIRLKLVQRVDRQLHLTSKGLRFVQAVDCAQHPID